jgi:uncharacterized radical SAM superfamily Fe-S cluster-containing enzyme
MDYEKRRQEEITKFCERHGLYYEDVDFFVEWFEWKKGQECKKDLLELIKKLNIK